MGAMKPVVVVGAGLAGVAAARVLTMAGLPTIVLDRGRSIGGRMASPASDGRVVDTGASYFTVSEPEFAAVVDGWRKRGLARPWTDTFLVTDGEATSQKSGPMRWAAPRGLRHLVLDLAEGLDIRAQLVTQVAPRLRVDGLAASAVVLAMPDPQARRVLHPSYAAELAALDDPYDPVLALTTRWPEAAWPAMDGAFVADNEIISWVADDGRRRGDDAPVLVAHSTPEFAAQHLVEPEKAVDLMVKALRQALGITTEPVSAQVQRWSFARPTRKRDEPYFLGPAMVGLCGDAWSTKPRVEAAYLSGAALGRTLVEKLR
ncbi:MAG: hypothetical protein JWP61_2216 [Friedmanniella sp.]|nr:hypothetical protein [Friedmanniella sp.]